MNEPMNKVSWASRSSDRNEKSGNFLSNLAHGFKRLQKIQFDAPWDRR